MGIRSRLASEFCIDSITMVTSKEHDDSGTPIACIFRGLKTIALDSNTYLVTPGAMLEGIIHHHVVSGQHLAIYPRVD